MPEKSIKLYTCNICQKSVLSPEKLKQHKNKYHKFGKDRFDLIKKSNIKST